MPWTDWKRKKIFRNSITIVWNSGSCRRAIPTGTLFGARRGLICTLIDTTLQTGGCATCQSLTVSTVSHRWLGVERSKLLKQLMPSVGKDTGLKVDQRGTGEATLHVVGSEIEDGINARNVEVIEK